MCASSRLLTALTLLITASLVPAVRGQSGFAASSYAAQHAAYAQQQAQYQQQAAAYQQQQQKAYAHQQQMAAHQQQMAAYQAQQQQQAVAEAPVARAMNTSSLVRFDGRYAAFSTALPAQVQYAVNAANYLQGKPYVRGGGHRSIEDRAYDCSSSVSYSLIKAGLLRSPLTSAGFANYGEPGQGRFITLWVKPGDHVFMTVCGLRLDTTGGREGEGPRWRTQGRSIAGFFPRHPAGL